MSDEHTERGSQKDTLNLQTNSEQTEEQVENVKETHETTYTKEQFDEVSNELAELKKQNMENTIKLELSKSGLGEDLLDLVADEDIEVAKTKISKLLELKQVSKVENSYKPTSVKKDDEYSRAKSNGNVEGMLKSKLSNLFK